MERVVSIWLQRRVCSPTESRAERLSTFHVNESSFYKKKETAVKMNR